MPIRFHYWSGGRYRGINKYDLLATVTDFTAYGVYRGCEKFIKKETNIQELFVSGGGAKNKYLVRVLNVKNIGMSPDAKEALCFAVLANETICGIPSNVPRVTGASRSAILGKVCIP